MVSVGEIMYRIQENPLLSSVKKSDIVNHIKTVIQLIGAPGLYEDKNITLEIFDFRAQVPKDFVSRTTARRLIDDNYRITLGHNTDQFYNTYPSLVEDGENTVDLLYTHKIVGDFIYVDFETGKVELAYKAFQTDVDGWPLLDGGASLILAVEWYIKKRTYEIRWEMGKISQAVYENTKQQYAWYIGQASNEINTPDPVEAEAIGNSIVRLLPQTDNFESNYKYDSQKERLNTKNYR